MNGHLLDTDTISLVVRGLGHARANLAAHELARLAVSTITLMEIEYGLSLNPRRRPIALAELGLWLPQVTVLPYGSQDVAVTASLRAALKLQGTPIGPYDLLNAGLALVRGLTLVTHNVVEYARVPGLRVEDWVTLAPRQG